MFEGGCVPQTCPLLSCQQLEHHRQEMGEGGIGVAGGPSSYPLLPEVYPRLEPGGKQCTHWLLGGAGTHQLGKMQRL